MIITHKMNVDLVRPGVEPMIHAMQGDQNTRKVEITLTHNGAAFTILEGTSAVMRYGKNDGSGGVYDTLPDGSAAYSIANNTVTVTLVPQMLTVRGIVRASVALVNGDAAIGVFPFRMIVEPDPSAGTVTPEDYKNLSFDGGYYAPAVTQVDENTVKFNFTPSKEDMPDVEDVMITLPNNPDSEQNGNGLSTTAANLLIEILQSAVYSTNVSGKIESLKEALASGGSSGGGDTGEDTPEEPTVTDDITVSDGIMTIVSVGAEITVFDGVLSIA